MFGCFAFSLFSARTERVNGSNKFLKNKIIRDFGIYGRSLTTPKRICVPFLISTADEQPIGKVQMKIRFASSFFDEMT